MRNNFKKLYLVSADKCIFRSMQILNKCFLIINCHYIKILLWPLCTVISAVDIDEVDNPDTFRYTDHCLSCRGTPKNGAWFNIYSVTYTFLLLSLLYGWWLNFYGIFFYSDLHGMNIFSWLSTYLEHHQWNISLISLYLMDFL